jgi:capsular exopolysaccharide synthesis family protein
MPPPRLRWPLTRSGGSAIPNDLDLFEDAPAAGGGKPDLRGVLQIVRRRYKVALITFLLLLGPALIPGLLVEPEYVAEAKVAIERAPEVMVFGGDFMPRLAGDPNRGDSVETMVMQSDRVLGRALDQVPAPPAARDSALSQMVAAVRDLLGFAPRNRAAPDPAIVRYLRIRGLRAALELQNTAGVVTIAITENDAERAVLLANAIADAYVEYDRESRRDASQQALSWLNQRAAELRTKLLSSREAMASISERLGTVPALLEDGGADDQRKGLTKDLEDRRLELFVTEQRLAQLEPQTARGPRKPPTAEALARQEEYAKLRTQLEQARMLYTPTHPELRRLEEAVTRLESGPLLGEVPIGDPLGAEKVRERESLNAQLVVLRAQIASIEKTLDEMVDDSVENAAEVSNYHRLRREVDLDEQLLSTIQQRISATVLSAARESATARVLDYAFLPYATGRKMFLLLLVGLAGAAGAGAGLALLLEFLDRREYDSSRAAATLGTQILARIPEMDPEELDPGRLATEGTVGAEALRRLCTALVYSGIGQEVRSLSVVSAVAGEGKTTTSTSLAATMAQTGRAVVVVDADMRRPRVNSALGLSRAPGLSDVLSGRAKLRDVIRSPKTLRFDVVTSGEIPDHPTELLSRQAFAQVLEELRGTYDVTIIDSPVLLAVSDALLVSAQVDGVLVVHRAGMAESDAFEAVAVDLKRVRARLVGMVANCVPPSDSYSYPSYLKSPYTLPSASRRRAWWWPFGSA